MSNDEDFVDIEDIQINNENEIEKENKFNEDIQENIENNEKKNEDIKNEINENNNIEENILNNNNKENENIEKDNLNVNPNIENNDNNNLGQKNKESSPLKKDFQSLIKKKNTFNTFDNSIHIHNPVPLSKMQIAENKYYKIKEELNKKYFNTNISEIPDETLDKSIIESKKYKEMISYLEQLNEVLTEILKSSRIQQKEAEKLKKKTVQKTPEQIYQEQQKMNDNQEKMIEIYKKQLASLQNRLNQVSKENFMEELIEKNKKLDEEIEKIKITNKKLNNEQKLNEIVISKQNKNEQEDKA